MTIDILSKTPTTHSTFSIVGYVRLYNNLDIQNRQCLSLLVC